MEIALKGVKVLDLSQYLAGPYGTMILGDLGAEIIKVEAVDIGPEVRRTDPLEACDDHGAGYLAFNRNKKSISIDLKHEEGLAVFYDLVKVCDVVFDNFRPGVLSRLKIDHDILKEINPRIICASATAFGTKGAWSHRPAFDAVLQAMTGVISLTGEPGEPVLTGLPVSDLSAGISAAHGILAALYAREQTGKGQLVEVSMLSASLSLAVFDTAGYLLKGILPEPRGKTNMLIAPYGIYQAKDGFMVIAAHRNFESFCRILGTREWADDPKFATVASRVKHARELNEKVKPFIKKKTVDEWVDLFDDADIPCSPVNTLDQTFAHPQLKEQDMIVEYDYVLGGKVKSVGNPIKMSATPPEIRKRFYSPPMIGQHTKEMLKALLGLSEERLKQLIRSKVIRQWEPNRSVDR